MVFCYSTLNRLISIYCWLTANGWTVPSKEIDVKCKRRELWFFPNSHPPPKKKCFDFLLLPYPTLKLKLSASFETLLHFWSFFFLSKEKKCAIWLKKKKKGAIRSSKAVVHVDQDVVVGMQDKVQGRGGLCSQACFIWQVSLCFNLSQKCFYLFHLLNGSMFSTTHLK